MKMIVIWIVWLGAIRAHIVAAGVNTLVGWMYRLDILPWTWRHNFSPELSSTTYQNAR